MSRNTRIEMDDVEVTGSVTFTVGEIVDALMYTDAANEVLRSLVAESSTSDLAEIVANRIDAEHGDWLTTLGEHSEGFAEALEVPEAEDKTRALSDDEAATMRYALAAFANIMHAINHGERAMVCERVLGAIARGEVVIREA